MFPLGLAKALTLTSRLSSKAVHVLRRIPVVDEALSRLETWLFNPVVVRRIRRANDPNLLEAMELYRKRIPACFRWEAADIIRWIKKGENTPEDDVTSVSDILMVAKFRRRVKGFVLLHCYPSHRIAYFAYLVVGANAPGLHSDQVSTELLYAVSKLLKSDKHFQACDNLLFEVEDPRSSSGKKQLEQLARIKRLCSLAASQGIPLTAFDVPYRQPRLCIPQNRSPEDEPLLLISAKLNLRNQKFRSLRSEVEDQLRFVFRVLYPEGFSTDVEEQEAYQSYCDGLHDAAVLALPKRISSLNPLHLSVDLKIKRRLKRQTTLKTTKGLSDLE